MADTWEWDGKEWTQMADTGPAARGEAAVAFDSKRGQVVLLAPPSMILGNGSIIRIRHHPALKFSYKGDFKEW